jgi:ketosteroid isomerase-like protein
MFGRMTNTYEKQLSLAAPRSEVERAVATIEGLRGWWTPIVCGSTGPGDELHFGFPGMDEHVVMRVEAGVPAVRWTCLEHTGAPRWRGSTVTFDVRDGGLRVRHGGVPRELVERGWDWFLDSLAALVEHGEGMPFGGEALAVARAYHRAWTAGDFAAAAALLSADLETDMPLNTYATKASFVAALADFGALVRETDVVAEVGRGREAIRLYDMVTDAFGTIRIAEHLTVADGEIVRIRHVHDTVALRAAVA